MCLPGDLGCEAAGAVLGGVAESAFNAIIKSTLESVTDMLAAISTMWFEVPDPQVGDSASLGTPSDSVGWLQTNLAGLVLLVGMLSLMLAIGRMLWNNSGRELLGVARMILAMLASTGFAVGVVTVLLEAGDAFARWIVQEAAGAQASAEAIVALWPLVADPGKTLWLVLGLLALLGAIMQVAFMVVRGAAVIVLMGLLPLVAANSATPEGNQQLRRVVGLLAGFVLYKPVAAIIYAVGIRLMHGVDGDLMSAVYGMVIIILAAVALPAMIKFFMPAAAAGSSNLFSGGTAATVAAGAAMVAVGGGAALAGGGGSAGVATAGGGGAGSSGLGRGAATAPPQGGGELRCRPGGRHRLTTCLRMCPQGGTLTACRAKGSRALEAHQARPRPVPPTSRDSQPREAHQARPRLEPPTSKGSRALEAHRARPRLVPPTSRDSRAHLGLCSVPLAVSWGMWVRRWSRGGVAVPIRLSLKGASDGKRVDHLRQFPETKGSGGAGSFGWRVGRAGGRRHAVDHVRSNGSASSCVALGRDCHVSGRPVVYAFKGWFDGL